MTISPTGSVAPTQPKSQTRVPSAPVAPAQPSRAQDSVQISAAGAKAASGDRDNDGDAQ